MDFDALKNMLENPYSLEKPQIKECYVAYVDILGYRQFFIDFSEKADALLDNITNGFQNVMRGIGLINGFSFIDNKIELRCFSDNLLVYCEVPDTNYRKQTLLLLIEVIKEIQRILILNYGLFIRGAIVKGQFAANEMFVFGKALIDAYEMENSIAKTPRIILSASIVNDLNNDVIYNDPVIQRAYNDLVNIYSLFESGSSYELAKRCYNAYKLFDDIIAEIPFAMPFDDMERLQSIRNDFYKMMDTINRNRGNYIILERVYKEIIKLKANMFDIFCSVANKRQKQQNDYIRILEHSSSFKDKDNLFVVDYLSFADYSSIIKPQIMELLLRSFIKELIGFPAFIDEITSYLDKSKLEAIRYHGLSLHKAVLLSTLMNDKEIYQQYISGSADSYNEKIIKKHLWTMQYHNLQCKKCGYDDLVINCTLSVGKNSSLYVENVGEADEPVNT